MDISAWPVVTADVVQNTNRNENLEAVTSVVASIVYSYLKKNIIDRVMFQASIFCTALGFRDGISTGD